MAPERAAQALRPAPRRHHRRRRGDPRGGGAAPRAASRSPRSTAACATACWSTCCGAASAGADDHSLAEAAHRAGPALPASTRRTRARWRGWRWRCSTSSRRCTACRRRRARCSRWRRCCTTSATRSATSATTSTRYYLIQNADIPGLAERERELVARIARYHRRSPPDREPRRRWRACRRPRSGWCASCATLCGVADSLDRSHHQPVQRRARQVRRPRTSWRSAMAKRAPVDLELWDVEPELALFREVFRRRLTIRGRSSQGTGRRFRRDP